jgi:hypothetical protein
VYERSTVTLAPEDLTFPPWYGDHWRPNQIGGLYAYFFGTGAITDPLVVQDGSADSSGRAPIPATDEPARSEEELAAARRRELSIEFTRRMADLVGTTVRGLDVDAPPPPGVSTPTEAGSGEVVGPPLGDRSPEDSYIDSEVGRIDARSPIGVAAEEVVRIYSQIRLNKFDVHSFIRAYTWRPIASMVDLFGTSNLEINDQGEVVRGVEGFHSRAFGDFDDLRTLVGNAEGRPPTILGLTIEEPDETDAADSRPRRDAVISARLDTRKEKRTAVLRYLLGLTAACGMLG